MLLINPATEKFGGFLSRYVPVGIPVAIGYIAMMRDGLYDMLVETVRFGPET